MRKQARFMIVTLLMLLVPALANAWTLTVKVTGGNDSNYVRVNKLLQDGTLSTVIREVKNGTVYLYPSGPVRISVQGSATPVMATVDGLDSRSVFSTPGYVEMASGSHTVAVAYDPAALTGSLTLQQAEGGQIHAQNRNSTWSATGVKGIEENAVVPVTIAADYNHKITGYESTITTGATTTTTTVNADSSYPDTAGGVKTLYLLAQGQTIKPTFAPVAKISAFLFAPTDGIVGRQINCTVVAASNVNDLQYAVIVRDKLNAEVTGVADAASFHFTPTTDGDYTIEVTVTSLTYDEFAPTVLTAKVKVAPEADKNAQCTSCHETSFPDKPNPLAAAIHTANSAATCTSCHPGDKAHSTSGLMGGSLQGRVLSGNVTVLPLASLGGVNNGPVGITTDGVNLFISDPSNNKVHNVLIATGVRTDLSDVPLGAGITTNGTTRYTSTSGITTDDVAMYLASGTVITKDGATMPVTGTTFVALKAITTDGVNLYLTDEDKVYKVAISTGVATIIATGIENPQGITTDGTYLYVVNVTATGNDTILKVDPITGAVTTLASVATTLNGITTDGFNLYVTSSTDRDIRMLKFTE